MQLLFAIIASFLATNFATASNLALDTEASEWLKETITNDEVAISLKRPTSISLSPSLARKRKHQQETLFAVEFPSATVQQKFSLQLDKETGSLNVLLKFEGETETKRFPLNESLGGEIFLEPQSILLIMKQDSSGPRLTLFADCHLRGTLIMDKTPRDVFLAMRNPQLFFYREKRYEIDLDMDVDLSVDEILSSTGCEVVEKSPSPVHSFTMSHASLPTSPQTSPQTSPPTSPSISIHTNHVNQRSAPQLTIVTQPPSERRGDIPMTSDCDESFMVKTMTNLVQLVTQLQTELDLQRTETTRLRQLLEQCNFCVSGSLLPALSVSKCDERTCFPSVECRDTERGPECGRCPDGYLGDGRQCKNVITCINKPCFEGVACEDLDIGYRCAACPEGFSGDGRMCVKPIITCNQNPCWPGVRCYDHPGGYRCDDCPPGYSGDGKRCSRISSCVSNNPCFPGVSCYDEDGGQTRCGHCPAGFSGNGTTCSRLWCLEQPCYPGVECTDVEGGTYSCGTCPFGTTGNGVQCYPFGERIDCIPSCFEGVTCEVTTIWDSGRGTNVTRKVAKCANCPPGYTGDGIKCRIQNPIITCRQLRCSTGQECRTSLDGIASCVNCDPGYRGDGVTCVPVLTCSQKPCPNGYQCKDTEDGPRCIRCANNQKGDGLSCSTIKCLEQPCTTGFQCEDTEDGPHCTRCPLGTTSEGLDCIYVTCKSVPCFPGVACTDVPGRGFRCNPCPSGMTGNGITCAPLPPTTSKIGLLCGERKCSNRCISSGHLSCNTSSTSSPCQLNPCPSGSSCYELLEPPYFRCGDGCSVGFMFNGSACIDVDECSFARPCDARVRCHNLSPGFRCEPCPPGYTGGVPQGVGIDYALAYKQRCYDLDECAFDNGGCGTQTCQNTDGSYRCVACRSVCTSSSTNTEEWSLQSSQISHSVVVKKSVSAAVSEFHNCVDGTKCHGNAECVQQRHTNHTVKIICKCKIGFAGYGAVICGKDTDLDGYPDVQLPCSAENCVKDNCPETPNSGQEDIDGDLIGDSCDEDADNDNIVNILDNCPFVANPDQRDDDKDGVGDVCPKIRPKKVLSEKEMRIAEEMDNNCVLISRGENREDECDVDIDRDGIADSLDNCPEDSNSAQLDTDNDGAGNECDEDIDGDGVPNLLDNCPLVANSDQQDTDGDDVGDVCQNDFDGDAVPDALDNCPNNSKIFTTDFRMYQTVVLDPEGDSQIDPNWLVLNRGAEISQTMNSDPGLAVGYDAFSGVDFEGTFFINTEMDDDYIGFVFAYQNNRNFYAVMWKKNSQTYWQATPFRSYAQPGVHIKLVNSATGPGQMMRNALWHSESIENQSKVLWKDTSNVGWTEKRAYRWQLVHRPEIGLIRLKIFDGQRVMVDSGNKFDFTLKGGRLGVFSFSQEMVVWSKLQYKCNDEVSAAIYHELPIDLKKHAILGNSLI